MCKTLNMLKNYYFLPDYDGWQKFNGGCVPDGYEISNFPNCGLMIRKIKSKEDVEKQERELYEKLKLKYN